MAKVALIILLAFAYSIQGLPSSQNDTAASLLEVMRVVNETVLSSMTAVIENINNYDAYVKETADIIVNQHIEAFAEKLEDFKTQMYKAGNSSNSEIILKCLVDEAKLDVLAETINQEVKQCATIASAEIVNVISDSINQAQMFMSIPQVIGQDVQECGVSLECIERIAEDAISESLQVPPKVMTIAARIQQLNLRTVVSIEACTLEGMRRITGLTMDNMQDILFCISDELQ